MVLFRMLFSKNSIPFYGDVGWDWLATASVVREQKVTECFMGNQKQRNEKNYSLFSYATSDRMLGVVS